jgi:hypothetical protein
MTNTIKTARSIKMAEKRAAKAASKARIEAAHAEAQAVATSGKCPQCGAGIRHNLALTGWIQCKQYGAVGFRADGNKVDCSYQGFTQ